MIFTATPQGLCASLVNEDILSKAKIIDLSADFRIKDVSVYEKWYGIEHKSSAVYQRGGIRTVRDQPRKGKRSKTGSQSGMLYQHALFLTAYPLVKEGTH